MFVYTSLSAEERAGWSSAHRTDKPRPTSCLALWFVLKVASISASFLGPSLRQALGHDGSHLLLIAMQTMRFVLGVVYTDRVPRGYSACALPDAAAPSLRQSAGRLIYGELFPQRPRLELRAWWTGREGLPPRSANTADGCACFRLVSPWRRPPRFSWQGGRQLAKLTAFSQRAIRRRGDSVAYECWAFFIACCGRGLQRMNSASLTKIRTDGPPAADTPPSEGNGFSSLSLTLHFGQIFMKNQWCFCFLFNSVKSTREQKTK